MDEEELKVTIGEAAFNAMSAEARTALLGKFSKSKDEDDEEEKPKGKKTAKARDDDEEEDDEDEGLRSKAIKARKASDDSKAQTKTLENALKFNLGVTDFVKNHADILPNEIQEILKVAEKETYDSATEKASALKKAFIESFFAVQSNVELLTTAQKVALDDFQKLTKNGKESKAEAIFENLLEPALETLKKVKKAEELGKARSGFASSNKVQDGYKARLISGSRKAYLGEKGTS